jgi:type II secretory pathway component GspD/PulD (secretin)
MFFWILAAIFVVARCPILVVHAQETGTETAVEQKSAVNIDIPLDAAAVAPETPQENVEIRADQKRLRDYNLHGMDRNLDDFTSIDPMEVSQVIESLTRNAGLSNIVITKGVAGQTTRLKLTNVTLADALEVILSVNNMAYEVKDGILKIMSDAEYMALYGVSFYDHKKVKIVQLKHTDATRMAAMLGSVKSGIGTIVPDQATGALILIDTPEKIREMELVVGKTDAMTETKTFVLQYAAVEDVKGEVDKLVTKEVGSLRVDKRTRTLIVTDLPQNMRKIEQLVQVFDKRTKQVFIEAKVIEVALNDEYSLGINWQHMFQGLNPRFAVQAVSSPGSIATPAGSFTYNTIAAGGDLSIVLQALKSIGKTQIRSNPTIAVMDGTEAHIEVAEDQPYKQIQMDPASGTNISAVTYIFKKVGVQLSVTPRINDEKFINVMVKPEISSISGWYDGAPQVGTPIIRKSLAETTVMVKDGVTIIIGGMISDQRYASTASVPLLGGIPLIGKLFRYDSVSSQNTETIVFLTPRIVGGDEPYLLMRDMKKEPKPMRRVGEGEDREKTLKPVR